MNPLIQNIQLNVDLSVLSTFFVTTHNTFHPLYLPGPLLLPTCGPEPTVLEPPALEYKLSGIYKFFVVVELE